MRPVMLLLISLILAPALAMAQAQSTPGPGVPATNDNGLAAATTGWVRGTIQSFARLGYWAQSGRGATTRSLDAKLKDLPVSPLDLVER